MTKVCQKQWLAHHVIRTCHQVAHRGHAYDINRVLQTCNGAEGRVCDVAIKDRQNWC